VLLSQVHRLRALVLLGRFLDMGGWAVDLALSVGIFPYVLKLLQTTAADLRTTLVFIWAKILALDASCQARHPAAGLSPRRRGVQSSRLGPTDVRRRLWLRPGPCSRSLRCTSPILCMPCQVQMGSTAQLMGICAVPPLRWAFHRVAGLTAGMLCHLRRRTW